MILRDLDEEQFAHLALKVPERFIILRDEYRNTHLIDRRKPGKSIIVATLDGLGNEIKTIMRKKK